MLAESYLDRWTFSTVLTPQRQFNLSDRLEVREETNMLHRNVLELLTFIPS